MACCSRSYPFSVQLHIDGVTTLRPSAFGERRFTE